MNKRGQQRFRTVLSIFFLSCLITGCGGSADYEKREDTETATLIFDLENLNKKSLIFLP